MDQEIDIDKTNGEECGIASCKHNAGQPCLIMSLSRKLAYPQEIKIEPMTGTEIAATLRNHPGLETCPLREQLTPLIYSYDKFRKNKKEGDDKITPIFNEQITKHLNGNGSQ